ncbi:MAG: histidine kinase dimerization/phospho-acceptor domain-containing protein [Nocardioidaceae bacterium]
MTRRLIVSYLGLALLILAVLEIPFAVLAQRHERDLTTNQAQREAAGLAAVVSEAVEHGHASDLGSISASYQARTGGEVSITDAAGRLVATSSKDGDEDVAGDERGLLQAALAGGSASVFTSDEGKPWVSAAVPISADGQAQGAVLLGVGASSTEGRIHAIWLALAAFGAGVLVLTAIVGMLMARSLALPLARLESAVTRLGDGDLSARAREDAGPPQVRSLAAQFNHMAARLAELVDAEARFVADASHQLRSPLTALRLRLENLEAGSGGAAGDGLAAAGREVQRLSRVVDGLLTLSRTGGAELDQAQVDVQAVIDERCDAWSALAEERGVELAAVVGERRPIETWLVPGDLDQILDNLLANALDVSSQGGRISVDIIDVDPGHLEVHVVDEGPGMTAEER